MTVTAAGSPANAANAAVEAPPLAPGSAPLCFVVDEEPSIRHFLSLVLRQRAATQGHELPAAAAG